MAERPNFLKTATNILEYDLQTFLFPDDIKVAQALYELNKDKSEIERKELRAYAKADNAQFTACIIKLIKNGYLKTRKDGENYFYQPTSLGKQRIEVILQATYLMQVAGKLPTDFPKLNKPE